MDNNLNSKIKKLSESLKKYEPEKIILFGSVSKNNFDNFSDIDIIMIKETDKNFVDRLIDIVPYINVSGQVDILVYTPKEWKEMEERKAPVFLSSQEGYVLYEK